MTKTRGYKSFEVTFVPEVKIVRRVRTPAGVRHYGQPIGTVIIRDALPNIRLTDESEWEGWDLVRGNNGRSFYVGKDGKNWVVTDENDNVLFEDRDDERVFQWMNDESGPATRPTPPPMRQGPTPPPKNRSRDVVSFREGERVKKTHLRAMDDDELRRLLDAQRRSYDTHNARMGGDPKKNLRVAKAYEANIRSIQEELDKRDEEMDDRPWFQGVDALSRGKLIAYEGPEWVSGVGRGNDLFIEGELNGYTPSGDGKVVNISVRDRTTGMSRTFAVLRSDLGKYGYTSADDSPVPAKLDANEAMALAEERGGPWVEHARRIQAALDRGDQKEVDRLVDLVDHDLKPLSMTEMAQADEMRAWSVQGPDYDRGIADAVRRYDDARGRKQFGSARYALGEALALREKRYPPSRDVRTVSVGPDGRPSRVSDDMDERGFDVAFERGFLVLRDDDGNEWSTPEPPGDPMPTIRRMVGRASASEVDAARTPEDDETISTLRGAKERSHERLLPRENRAHVLRNLETARMYASSTPLKRDINRLSMAVREGRHDPDALQRELARIAKKAAADDKDFYRLSIENALKVARQFVLDSKDHQDDSDNPRLIGYGGFAMDAWPGVYGWDYGDEADIDWDDYDQRFKLARDYMVSTYGIRVGYDIHPDAIETVNGTLDAYDEMFPGFGGLIRSFDAERPPQRGALAWVRSFPHEGQVGYKGNLGVSSHYFDIDSEEESWDTYIKIKEHSSDSGWFSVDFDEVRAYAGDDMEEWRSALYGTLNHEFGHLVHNVGYNRGTPEQRARIDAVLTDYGVLSTRKATTYGEVASLKKAAVRELLSEYGASNLHEMFAEAWAEYMMSPNPRSFAYDIGQAMEENLTEALERRQQWNA